MRCGRVSLLLAMLFFSAACGGSPSPEPRAPSPPPAPTAVAAEPAKPKPAVGAWGFDLSGMDRSVKPGDDFFAYTSGTWAKTTAIPADRARFGTFDQLGEQSVVDVHALLEDLGDTAGEPGSQTRKVVDFYRTFLDTGAIDAAGLAPLAPALAAIVAAKTHEDIAALLGRHDLPLQGPFEVAITEDQKNPDRYVLTVAQSGLGLPDKDYYLKDDERMRTVRAKYLVHLARVLELAHVPSAAKEAQAIFDFEMAAAKLHWDRAKSRDRDLTYNLRTKAELQKSAPDFPWARLLDTAGVGGQTELVLRQVDAIAPLAALFRKTPVSTWKSKLTVSLIANWASVLPKSIDDEVFEFRGRVLTGQPEQRARWKRGVAAVNQALGEAVGALYVERHFPPASKAAIVALVENLRRAYATRIDALSWMTPETKVVAREKLAAFAVKVGYPDRFRDYSALEVKKGDALGNLQRATLFEWNRQAKRIGQKTDRGEWTMVPQTVNAYYNATFNEIVFPAAILQPPYFDPNADPAVNYGSIGGVIGHEMGHGFDDQGAKADARGVLRTWWNDRDVAAFKKLVDSLADQYAAYEALPGVKLNGRLELGENIGDNGGLQVAREAYLLSRNGQADTVLDGFSADQRFFLGWAQVWRTVTRDEELRNRVMTDNHAPGQFRAKGPVRNMDSWYAAFDVKPGDRGYLPPEARVKIW
jgi:putative endopeptidase